jgi:SAM-dependent methyltransferase
MPRRSAGADVGWPKVRPELSERQTLVLEDWYSQFLNEVLPGRYGWVDKWNHSYAARSARAGERTLEIGPGTGSHLDFEDIASQVEYVGLELRDTFSQEMRVRYPNVRVVVGDCQRGIDFPDGYFDRVLAIHVLEHLENLPAALAEVRRVLRPSGRLVVVIPCEGGIGYGLGRKVTVQRTFERRYGLPYAWVTSFEHVNTAWEVLRECQARFQSLSQSYFPLGVHSVDLNLLIGLTLSVADVRP